MVNIKIELDKLTSMLVSYHILCAPTSMNMQFNPDVFRNLKVTPEERGHYLTYLLSRGITFDKTDSVRTSLFLPEAREIDDLFRKRAEGMTDEVEENFRAFETRFNPYLEHVRAKVEPLIPQRSRESQQSIDNIYNLAQEFTGVRIERPEDMEVRIVEGIAPSSIGSMVRNRRGYVVEQTRNFLSEQSSYLLTLIHESVAHQTARGARGDLKEIFGENVYDVEEGFAKLFSKRIAERILGHGVDYDASKGLQDLAYQVFNKNWNSLNGNNFNSWYISCLTQIKNARKK